ncbi:MAG TPA: SRPBCC family protein [Anaerolineales bacterium]|nr:SRPBCC family protein [Anaerolineales bacterium]
MIQVEKSVVINKPVAEVFAFVTDSGNTTQWQGGVEAVIPDGAPNVVGSKYTEVRKFMGQEMRSVLEITAFEPDSKWAAKVVKGPVPYEVTATFEPVGEGSKMTTRVEGEPKGFFKVAQGVLAGQLEKALEEDGNRLKKILEGG